MIRWDIDLCCYFTAVAAKLQAENCGVCGRGFRGEDRYGEGDRISGGYFPGILISVLRYDKIREKFSERGLTDDEDERILRHGTARHGVNNVFLSGAGTALPVCHTLKSNQMQKSTLFGR